MRPYILFTLAATWYTSSNAAVVNTTKRDESPQEPWGRNGPQLGDIEDYFALNLQCLQDKFDRAAMAAIAVMTKCNPLWPKALFKKDGTKEVEGADVDEWQVLLYPPEGRDPGITDTPKYDVKHRWIPIGDEPSKDFDAKVWWVAALHAQLVYYWDETKKASDVFDKWKADTLSENSSSNKIIDDNLFEVAFVMCLLFDREVQFISRAANDILEHADISPMIQLSVKEDEEGTESNKSTFGTLPVMSVFPQTDKGEWHADLKLNDINWRGQCQKVDEKVAEGYIANLVDRQEAWGPDWYSKNKS